MRRKQSGFQRAADGSMTLVDHIRELRSRLLKATIAVIVGAVVTYFFATQIQAFILSPYCDYMVSRNANGSCAMNSAGVLDPFMLQLKIALYGGIVLTSPVWLYQLWAFIAPGLHKRERRYTYIFVAAAAPLFAFGVWLGFELFTRSIQFFLSLTPSITLTYDITGYFDFVTMVMLFFGIGFEVPVFVALLNVAGLVSARRLLSWWRVAVFLMFVFAAFVTPTPDPFNMTILALCMSVLYFSAVGFAFLNDARRARRRATTAGVADDEVSPIEPVSPVDASTWGAHGADSHRTDDQQ